MSLYYDLSKDSDYMNSLIANWGFCAGMAKFRESKIAEGYHEEVSCEGAARITRWVKNEKTPKVATKPDVKADVEEDVKPDSPIAGGGGGIAPEDLIPPPRVQRLRWVIRNGIIADVSRKKAGCFEKIECTEHGDVCVTDSRVWMPHREWKCPHCKSRATFRMY